MNSNGNGNNSITEPACLSIYVSTIIVSGVLIQQAVSEVDPGKEPGLQTSSAIQQLKLWRTGLQDDNLMQCSGTIGPPNSILDVRAERVNKGIFLHVKNSEPKPLLSLTQLSGKPISGLVAMVSIELQPSRRVVDGNRTSGAFDLRQASMRCDTSMQLCHTA